MIFTKTGLEGAYIVDIERREDERGFFARTWCGREFAARGLDIRVAQCSVSFNVKKGTLRGMHYQVKPFEEAKLVRCTKGSLYDVVVDLRPESPTYAKHAGAVLTAGDMRMIYIPGGVAHGFITLEDATEVFYQISEFYSPEAQRGFRWNDPAFGIVWPAEVRIISDRDRNYPDFKA